MIEEKLAKINIVNQHLEEGVGQAIFDDEQNPTKRYFLEKRWKEDGEIFGAILTNPSKAGSLEGDDTVDTLIRYAKEKNYVALYVVNIIPLIKSNSKNLTDDYSAMVKEDIQKKCVCFALENSDTILIGWGKDGQKYFSALLEDEMLKNLFLQKKNICKAVGFSVNGKFPLHPRPNGPTKYDFENHKTLLAAGEKLEQWIENI